MPLKTNLRALLAAALLCLSILLPPSIVFAQAASAPETPPAAAATAPTVTKETIDNPYGLEALWKQGDFVARARWSSWSSCRMGSWYIIFTKLFEQRKLLKSAKACERELLDCGLGAGRAPDTLEEGSAFRYIAEKRHQGRRAPRGQPARADRPATTGSRCAIQRAVDNIASRLQDGLAFLATVGSTAPFVGLFGTVWGIYHALTAIGIAGQASIDKVAGPVGEALIMTAIGLAVAVPAVLGYNWLIRRNKVAMERVRAFSARPAHLAAVRQALTR